MNFLYFPIFCVFFSPTRGQLSFRFLRSPESTPDKLDLRINGSIDLGSKWNVQESLNKIGQNLRQDNRDLISKIERQDKNADVRYNEGMSENARSKWDRHSRESHWVSSVVNKIERQNENSDVQYNSMYENARSKCDRHSRESHWVSSVVRQPEDRNSDTPDTVPIETISDTREAVQSDDVDGWDDRDEGNLKDIGIWKHNGNKQKQEALDKRDMVPRKKMEKDSIVGYTQFERMKTTYHKVKDVARTKEFSIHLFKQTMQVFDSIKRKMSDADMKAKVDDMARSYKDQFGEFVRQQREASVRTKLGDQRAILHTMDTSNAILQRLVNFLKADMEHAQIGRSHDNTLQRVVDAARDLEYKHVCSKYGYCRTDQGFTKMLQNCLKKIVSVDDGKMYQARDAITEVLKTADYSKLIDSKTDKSFKKKVKRLETKEPEDIREGLIILLGMLSNAQTPLVVEGENSEVVKKTAAFYTLLAMWEDAMPPDEANKLEWADIQKSLGDWSEGKRTDIFEIIKALERNMKRGFRNIDPDTEVKMKEQVKIIRG